MAKPQTIAEALDELEGKVVRTAAASSRAR
jgi:hypothetical protein